jgi:hypothetical protein
VKSSLIVSLKLSIGGRRFNYFYCSCSKQRGRRENRHFESHHLLSWVRVWCLLFLSISAISEFVCGYRSNMEETNNLCCCRSAPAIRFMTSIYGFEVGARLKTKSFGKTIVLQLTDVTIENTRSGFLTQNWDLWEIDERNKLKIEWGTIEDLVSSRRFGLGNTKM